MGREGVGQVEEVGQVGVDREERERRVSRAGWEEAVRQPHLQAGEADHLGPVPPIGFLQTWTSPS